MNCPLCGALLDQDFGVVTCSSCHAVLSIDLDGTITVSSEAHPQSQTENAQIMETPTEEFYETPQDPSSDNPSIENLELISEDVITESPSESVNSSPTFEDVAEFANSEGEPGTLSYTVVISEINGGDVRKAVTVALTDPRFQWNAQEIMSALKNGKVTIESINPAKAAALVLRLRGLPVKVSWIQQIYS